MAEETVKAYKGEARGIVGLHGAECLSPADASVNFPGTTRARRQVSPAQVATSLVAFRRASTVFPCIVLHVTPSLASRTFPFHQVNSLTDARFAPRLLVERHVS